MIPPRPLVRPPDSSFVQCLLAFGSYQLRKGTRRGSVQYRRLVRSPKPREFAAAIWAAKGNNFSGYMSAQKAMETMLEGEETLQFEHDSTMALSFVLQIPSFVQCLFVFGNYQHRKGARRRSVWYGRLVRAPKAWQFAAACQLDDRKSRHELFSYEITLKETFRTVVSFIQTPHLSSKGQQYFRLHVGTDG